MVQLAGGQIELRELEFTDWAGVHAYASLEIACRYQPWGPNTEEESQAFVREAVEDGAQTPRTRFVFAIVPHNTGKMIGAGELNIRDRTNRNGEIGYIVHPDYWGRGIATEAAVLLTDFGFQALRLHRIYATCDPRNTGSAKVLTKLGMTQEGRLRDTLLLRDGWRDSLLFGILEEEWKSSAAGKV
ncbi:GNAT family N-acetyltransferase [Paenibacillus humicola]|uniref:GNAT family N-acetyltransferase n=1 Tax=Paenibacillus humicola TaxID=3110540 RepID=UPI00237B243C|nr:GNAT family protein [Paenibacillus humicola]